MVSSINLSVSLDLVNRIRSGALSSPTHPWSTQVDISLRTFSLILSIVYTFFSPLCIEVWVFIIGISTGKCVIIKCIVPHTCILKFIDKNFAYFPSIIIPLTLSYYALYSFCLTLLLLFKKKRTYALSSFYYVSLKTYLCIFSYFGIFLTSSFAPFTCLKSAMPYKSVNLLHNMFLSFPFYISLRSTSFFPSCFSLKLWYIC